MIAGTLKELIEVWTPQKVKNDYGEEIIEWRKKLDTRARLIHNSGNKSVVNYEVFYSHNKMLQVRDYVDVKDFDRIKYNGQFYDVIDIEPNKDQMMQQIVIELTND